MNNADCVLQSFSYVTDTPVATLIRLLGHDGTEVINPTLPEPFNVRGFNLNEMFRVAHALDYACTNIERTDYIYNKHMEGPTVIGVGDQVSRYLEHPRYCLYSKDHMIGIRNGVVKDGSGAWTHIHKSFPYEGIILVDRIIPYRVH